MVCLADSTVRCHAKIFLLEAKYLPLNYSCLIQTLTGRSQYSTVSASSRPVLAPDLDHSDTIADTLFLDHSYDHSQKSVPGQATVADP